MSAFFLTDLPQDYTSKKEQLGIIRMALVKDHLKLLKQGSVVLRN